MAIEAGGRLESVRVIKIDSAKTVSRTCSSSISTLKEFETLVRPTFFNANMYIDFETSSIDNAAEVAEMGSIFRGK